MDKEELLKKIEALCKTAKSNKNSIDQKAISDAFKEDKLTDEQMDSVNRLIENRGIEINPDVDEAEIAKMEKGGSKMDEDEIDTLDEDDFPKDGEEEDIDLNAVDLLEGIGTEDPVRMYLKEIGTVPLLSNDEEY